MLITPIYAAILGLFFIFLSFRTIGIRRNAKVLIGDGDNQLLQRAIRVHGNFAEYVPIALILIFFLETQISSKIVIHLLLIALIIGRVIHFYGVRQVNENLKFRVAGMVITFTTIIIASVSLIISYIL